MVKFTKLLIVIAGGLLAVSILDGYDFLQIILVIIISCLILLLINLK